MELEQIRARLTADSAQFVSGMGQAQQSLQRLSTTGAQSTKAFSMLKNGMVGLAAQATGLQGPIGKVVQSLLMFGGGSGLVLGVAAGVGGIALAYRALTADAREAAKANDELMVSLAKISVHGRLLAERMTLQKMQADLAAEERNPLTRMGGIAAQQRLTEMRNAILRQEQQILHFEREAANEIERQLGVIGLVRREDELRVHALKDGLSTMLRMKGVMDDMLPKGQTPEMGIKAKGGNVLGDSSLAFGVDEMQKEIFETVADASMQERVRELGISLGRQFMMGLIEGIQSMQDVLRMIFMAVLDFAIGSLLNSILPGVGAAVSPAGGAKGMGAVPKLGPASMSVGINMSGVQPLTAYAVSRDPAFQALLREGILVAGANGFRGR